VARTLITGMSGAGKSTLLAELARRGHLTIDTDYDHWTLPDGLWDEARIASLLDKHRDLFLSGTVENQGTFYDRFEHVVLLTAPTEVLINRVTNRVSNRYGHSMADQTQIRQYVRDVEPLLRNTATIELDGQRAVSDLADELELLVRSV
jgi:shikimate kinase